MRHQSDSLTFQEALNLPQFCPIDGKPLGITAWNSHDTANDPAVIVVTWTCACGSELEVRYEDADERFDKPVVVEVVRELIKT